MTHKLRSLLATLLLGAASNVVMSATDGHYLQLSSDLQITGRTEILSKTISLGQSASLVVQSDGRIFPNTGNDAAVIWIEVDGQIVSNKAVQDWRGSYLQKQHSYNVVGGVSVAAGTHRIKLLSDRISGAFTIGASSNLSAIVQPAEKVSYARLGADSSAFNFTTAGYHCYDGFNEEPHTRVLGLTFSNPRRQDVIALAAARSYVSGHQGDAMLGLYLNGQGVDGRSVWPVEDMCDCAQLQAPMSTHAHFLNVPAGNQTVSLDASEYPWCGITPSENPVIYRVGDSSSLVVMSGGMQVKGSAQDLARQICLAGAPGVANCPSAGTSVVVSKGTVTVPAGHNGIVMVIGKMRLQPKDSADTGTAYLWLDIDGYWVGSMGVQEFKAPVGISQATMYASYLATGTAKLSPGTHQVKLYASVDQSSTITRRIENSEENLALLWFD